MYLPTNSLDREVLVRFSPDSDIRPNCAWYDLTTQKWHVGASSGSIWKYLERAWSHDTYGTWSYAPPALIQPIGLVPIDTDGDIYPTERQGDDPVYLIGTGETIRLYWLQQTLQAPEGVLAGQNAYLNIYDASDGSLAFSAVSPSLPTEVGVLDDGSYAVHVGYHGIEEGLRIPPGAVRLPEYDYTTQGGRLSHYNPVQNWGEYPADDANPLVVLRHQLVETGQNQDVEEWAYYLTSELPMDGEGAMIKLQVGGGNWTIADGVFVSPARNLFYLDLTTPLPENESPSTPVELRLDPLASQITFYKKCVNGRVLLGGSRMNQDGTHPALWEWDPVNQVGVLVATTKLAPRALCEQRLSTGGVTGVEERADGKIVVLTLCSRHLVDETRQYHEDRMPRYPYALDGEPGGRSLVTVDDLTHHLTEGFGRQPDPETESFYNLLVDVRGDRLLYSAGTIAHLDSAMWKHRGKCWGVRGDAYPQEDGALAYITWYNGMWDRTPLPWRANWLLPQRGASVNGRMIIFGWVQGSETSQVILSSDQYDEVLSFDYRVRGLFLTDGPDVYYRQLACAAKKVISSTELDDAWSVISTKANYVPPTVTNPTEETEYRVIHLDVQSPVYSIQLYDCTDGVLTTENEAAGRCLVRARVDSDALTSSLESYTLCLPVGVEYSLPVEAHERVEVLVVWPTRLGQLELPIIGVRS